MAIVGQEVTGNITANGNTVTASCAPWDIATVQFTASAFSGTLTFEGSVDGGTTWQSLAGATGAAPGTVTVVSTTAAGFWLFNVSPFTHVRVRCSAFVSATTAVVRIGFGDTQ